MAEPARLSPLPRPPPSAPTRKLARRALRSLSGLVPPGRGGVVNASSAPSQSSHCHSPRGCAGVRFSLARQGRQHAGIAAKGTTPACGPVDHQVQAALVPRPYSRRLSAPASGPTASRATRTQARSTTFARHARRPVRGHARVWSPNGSGRASFDRVCSFLCFTLKQPVSCKDILSFVLYCKHLYQLQTCPGLCASYLVGSNQWKHKGISA